MGKITSYFREKILNNNRLLFWFAIVGLATYAFGPIIFPHAPVRDPALIPIYTVMLGAGSVAKDKKRKQRDKESDED